MRFLGLVRPYIAVGGLPARPKGWMPLRITSRPLDGRDAPAGPCRDLFANKKVAKRPSGHLPPAGWAGGPNHRAGCTHFSKFSPPAPLFLISFFYPFFLKKSPGWEGPGLGPGALHGPEVQAHRRRLGPERRSVKPGLRDGHHQAGSRQGQDGAQGNICRNCAVLN
jgi:hypothetical protein